MYYTVSYRTLIPIEQIKDTEMENYDPENGNSSQEAWRGRNQHNEPLILSRYLFYCNIGGLLPND